MERAPVIIDRPEAAAQDEQPPTHIIAVGASAGGMEPIEKFIQSTPKTTGYAIVIVQHLSPDFKSLMNEILIRQTDIPILRIENGMPVWADNIYLIPPRKDLSIRDGRLWLTDTDNTVFHTPRPIDVFLASLAAEWRERCAAVILSGTGCDGSEGARAIASAGGVVMAQEPSTARFEAMPCGVIGSVQETIVLPPDQMPLAITCAFGGLAPIPQRAEGPVLDDPYATIFNLLSRQFGIDFNLYKLSTVHRRIARRVELSGIGNLEHYVRFLTESPEELEILYFDLLISVTRFFRDPEAFEALATKVVPTLIAERPPRQAVRVWVPACASGEEAYSIAILLMEEARKANKTPNLSVFATDVHRRSLEIAAAGLFAKEQLEDLDPELVERYFTPVDGMFRVRNELRRSIVFSNQDLLKDPLFTKIDLVSCRNFLIYLTSEAQRTVIARLHFSLRKGGYLFLGMSEALGEFEGDFEQIESRWNLFRKRNEGGLRIAADLLVPNQPARSRRLLSAPGASGGTDVQTRQVYELLLTQLLPSALLVDEHGGLCHIFGDASRHLTFTPGPFQQRVMDLVHPSVRGALSNGLYKAKLRGQRVLVRNASTDDEQDDQTIAIAIHPIGGPPLTSTYFLIRFEDAKQPSQSLTEGANAEQAPIVVDQDDFAQRITELEHELQSTEESLQTTIEELQASNEELMASNEELQSTNEELHSVNEELHTVSAEHQARLGELTEVTNDLENLLRSLDLAIVFLDSSYCIRRFTPAATRYFSLVQHDIGRRLDDVRWRFVSKEIEGAIRQTLAGDDQCVVQGAMENGDPIRIGVVPYRSSTDFIEGVVLSITG